ncbi:MAG: NUDIX domain-containing protein [Chitinophagales bacterium]
MIQEVAAALLFDRNGRLLIYLRDDKPEISYPNHWDLFGGMVEEDETPEHALVREVEEELGIRLNMFTLYRDYDSFGERIPNRKYVYVAHVNYIPEELTLRDGGQYLISIPLSERHNYKFANILGQIIDDYANKVEEG